MCRIIQRSLMRNLFANRCWLLLGIFPLTLASSLAADAPDSGRILLKTKAGVSATTMSRFHSQLKASAIQSFPALGNLQVVQAPAGITAERLVAEYQASGLVE